MRREKIEPGLELFPLLRSPIIQVEDSKKESDPMKKNTRATWQQVTGTVTAPEGASAMKIVLINQQSSGWVAFEDVSATQLKPATKYYYAGDQRVGLRTNGALTYLLGDHLGSTSLALDAGGAKTAELRYKAWGEVRYGWSAGAGLATNYTYTGQRSYMDDPTTPAAEGFGLMYYNARWLDPALGRFSQADTIVPALFASKLPARLPEPSPAATVSETDVPLPLTPLRLVTKKFLSAVLS